jgi:predicted metal-dependent hydrolase
MERGANVLAGMGPTAIAHRTDICLKGHGLDDALIDGATGRRRCRTCTNDKNHIQYEKNAEARRQYARDYRNRNAERLTQQRKDKWASRAI